MAQSEAGSTHTYDAFVSYSHAADNELAPVLQKYMQSFARPWFRLRSMRVFRDDTTLVLTPHLWPDIRNAMDAARYFVLLASPQAAQSRWVQQEVSHWITTRGADTLLILLTDGKIEWNDAANDFDWTLSTALPPVLKGAYAAEPKWEDVSSLTNPGDLTMQNPILGKTIASLYSAITGKPLDEVIGEDVRQFRRTRMIVGATCSTFLAGVIGFGWYALETRKVRELEKLEDEQQREERITARSRYVAEQARQILERGDAGAALNVVLEDTEHNPEVDGPRPSVPETHMTLFSGLHGNLERDILPAQAEAHIVAFAPNGTILVAAQRTVLLFDPGSRVPKLRLLHGAKVTAAAFSRDGQRVLTAANDRKARIWDMSGKEVKVFEHGDEVVTAVFDPTETMVATTSKDDTAAIWDVATGQRKMALAHESDVMDIAWAEKGQRLLTVTVKGMVRAWDLPTGVELFKAQAGSDVKLKSISLNHDGTRAVTAGGGVGAAVLWNTKDGSVVKVLSHGRSRWASNVTSAVFSPKDNLIVTTGSDQRAAVWETERGDLLYTLLDHSQGVSGSAFSPDGSRLVTFSEDRTARVYAACDGRALAVLRGHTEDIVSASFSPDGCSVLTGSGDATARRWDLVQRPGQTVLAEQQCVPGLGRSTSEPCRAQSEFASLRRDLLGAAISEDGKWVATAAVDGIARVYDAATGARIAALPAQPQAIRTVAFDASGKVLLAGQGGIRTGQPGTLRVWDWREGRELIANGIAHTGAVNAASFSPDGARILTASRDGAAQIFDAKSGAALLRVDTPAECNWGPCGLTSASWSPDGRRIATASASNKACVWDVEGRSGAVSMPALCVAHKGIVYTVKWNTQGTHILTASGDQTAVVWNARSGEAERRFQGDDFDFRTAEFFAGDTQIMTANNDYAVRFWFAGSGREAARLTHRQAFITAAMMDKSSHALLTASRDGIARIWTLPASEEEAIKMARASLKRCLSPQQRSEFNLTHKQLPSWCAGKLWGSASEHPQPVSTQSTASTGQ